jgi:hypothetical protein
MTGDDFRRLLPPPRRRPGLLAMCVRWRIEIVTVVAVTAAWQRFGATTLTLGVLMLTSVLIIVPVTRRLALGLLQAVVVPHRVRSGLVQGGVADRSGRLPWIVAARPRGDAVQVTVWLRSGTSVRDLTGAMPIVATACGARGVEVERYSERQDRVMLLVVRPRWGWWTR